MRHIAVVVALVDDQRPVFSIVACQNTILVVDVVGAVVLHGVMVIEVELHGSHGAHAA